MSKPRIENKKIVILKSSTDSFKGTEEYLQRHGWIVYSFTDLHESLLKTIAEYPGFFLISVNYQHNNIVQLPNLIQSKFPQVTVVAFGENQFPQTLSRLRECASRHVLYPTVTGMNIEKLAMKITQQQVLADQKEKKFSEDLLVKKANVTPTLVEQKAEILEKHLANNSIPHLAEKGQEMISIIDHLAKKVGLLPVRIIEQIEEQANKLQAELQPPSEETKN